MYGNASFVVGSACALTNCKETSMAENVNIIIKAIVEIFDLFFRFCIIFFPQFLYSF
jgi:hypothetical protein